MKAILLDKALS